MLYHIITNCLPKSKDTRKSPIQSYKHYKPVFYMSSYPLHTLYPFFINTHLIHFLSSNISENQKPSKARLCLSFRFVFSRNLLCFNLHLLSVVLSTMYSCDMKSLVLSSPSLPCRQSCFCESLPQLSFSPTACPHGESAPALAALRTSLTSPQFVGMVSRYDLTSNSSPQ